MTGKTGIGASAAGVNSLVRPCAMCYFQNGFTLTGCTHSFTIKINVMKLLLAALSLFFFHRPADPLLVIDKDLKKPAAYATTFTKAFTLEDPPARVLWSWKYAMPLFSS